MKEILQRTCEKFIENVALLKRCMRSSDSRIRAVCAISLLKAPYADETLINECKEIVNRETGVFSNFRGYAKLPSITLLAVSAHPETQMDTVRETYQVLKEHFHGSTYLALSAMALSELASDWELEETAARGRRIYKKMRKEHPFLTSSEDTAFSVMLAMSDRSDEDLIEEMETCYSTLRTWLPSSDGLQTLSHVLTLADGTAAQKCEKIKEIYQRLRQGGRKFGKNYELSTLGCVSILPLGADQIAADMLEVDAFLRTQKGYGFWGLDKRSRLMHAAMLVSAAYAETPGQNVSMNAAALSSVLAMIAAEQAVMCAVIASTAASNAASAS